MTVFDLTAAFLEAAAEADPMGVLVGATVVPLLEQVAEFHIERGARNAHRLAAELGT